MCEWASLLPIKSCFQVFLSFLLRKKPVSLVETRVFWEHLDQEILARPRFRAFLSEFRGARWVFYNFFIVFCQFPPNFRGPGVVFWDRFVCVSLFFTYWMWVVWWGFCTFATEFSASRAGRRNPLWSINSISWLFGTSWNLRNFKEYVTDNGRWCLRFTAWTDLSDDSGNSYGLKM